MVRADNSFHGSDSDKKSSSEKVNVLIDDASQMSSDELELARLGYKSEFKREFRNFSTISFAFSIMGVTSSVATTFDTPMLLGGPASVIWCWLMGSVMCLALGASIAELVSAYPTSGGLYSASAYLVPRQWRPIVGWIVGWLNVLGQIAGVASTEFGLSRMIWAAVVISKGPDALGPGLPYVPTAAQTVGLFIGLLAVHGLINSLPTRFLARITSSFVIVNLGTALIIIITLLATTDNKHSAEYTFTNVNNQSGWPSDGFAFLLGLLSVHWTMTDFDATAHISEEIKKASVAAPAAIFVAVIGTGIVGWVYNIVLVLCSGPIENLPGPSGLSVATILANNLGTKGFLVIWTFVCMVAFFVVTTALQANSRTFYAFSRDNALPDRGLFGKLAPNKIPIAAVWLVVAISIVLGCLDFASPVAANAIFSLCAVALDTSYIIPIICLTIFRNHPDVRFKPGPFHLGTGLFGNFVRWVAIVWVCFEVTILCCPSIIPITALNMNYAAVITAGVLILSMVWWYAGARKVYNGPARTIDEHDLQAIEDKNRGQA